MIVAIDGPSGAGKSTVAKAVARKLGFSCLDTGAMYRAIAWKALEEGIDLADAAALGELERGDIIQLGDASDKWYHSLFVTAVTENDILVSTHTFDAYRRPLSSYVYAQARGIRIEGARRW